MKTIPEIKKEQEAKLSELFKTCGVFFAFSNEQFESNKTPLEEGEKYVTIGGGGYLPKGKVTEFKDGMSALDKWYKAEIKSNKARKAHILYELNNHEAFYTHDIEDTLECLGEGYSRVTPKHLNKYVQEFVFRFNNRNLGVLEQIEGIINNMVCRLKYKDLIA